MQSKFVIRADFDRNTPFISLLQKHSDDTRDELVKAFTEKLLGDSSWCKIVCIGDLHIGKNEEGSHWKITPLSPDELEAEAAEMNKAAQRWKQWLKENNIKTK